MLSIKDKKFFKFYRCIAEYEKFIKIVNNHILQETPEIPIALIEYKVFDYTKIAESVKNKLEKKGWKVLIAHGGTNMYIYDENNPPKDLPQNELIILDS